MQNKGFVKVFAVLLTLVCVFYLSFSFVTRHYENKAREAATKDGKLDEKAMNDSLTAWSNKTVYLWNWTLKDCREMEINLGLDLKGGMNVVLEVSVPDVLKALADHKTDEAFNTALTNAARAAESSQQDVIALFIEEYHKLAPDARLSTLFATQQLSSRENDKITPQSSDAEVEKIIRKEVDAAIANSFNVLRTRIDRFGVAQPNIQELKGTGQMGRIMVELPGIKDKDRVRKLLQGSANLEFWETYTAKEVYPYLQAADNRIRALNSENEAAEATEETAEATAETDTTEQQPDLAADIQAQTKGESATANLSQEQLKKQNPLLAILQPVPSSAGPVAGYADRKDTAEINRYLSLPEVKAQMPRDLKLMWGVAPVSKESTIFELYAIKSTERNGRAPLEGDVVVSAQDDFDQRGKPAVSMSMNNDGARRWAALTKKNINRSIAIVLDGCVYSAPNVNTEITGGRSQITGNFTPEEAKDLANVLRSGKMPAPARIVQEDVVGPSLGQEAIDAGVLSFIVALILLMIYMCAIYGFTPGMVANCALILNMFFTLGILSSFQAALTMSGIAGMVLSLGMAVDANVLIYERTKEELRAGKGVKKALADGYSNAFSAIFDSNLTSIITGIILFNFGTGPIKGFATTLIIGIIISFFTAVFMTRLVYEHFMNKDKWLGLTFTSGFAKNMMANTHFNFMGRRFVWLGTAVVIVLVCCASLAIRGLSKSIDFTGGRNYSVRFEQPVSLEQVRGLMLNVFEGSNTSVIAIGTSGTEVRISTNYHYEDSSLEMDQSIEHTLYETLKPLLPASMSYEEFTAPENDQVGGIVSQQKVAASISADITRSAIKSVVWALIAIFLYILIRFRNISYSVGSVVALTVDVIIILGAYSLCWGWMPFSLEVDQTFIGAILTAIGYSINDKVVIFDRVREFFGLYPKRGKLQLFNDSLNTTLARTINTSVSTLIVLLCIFILGGASIRSFAFAMILGVVFGTMSSLFIASPIAYSLMKTKKSDEVLEETKTK